MLKQLVFILIFVALLSLLHVFSLGGLQHQKQLIIITSPDNKKNSENHQIGDEETNHKTSSQEEENNNGNQQPPEIRTRDKNCKPLPLHQNASQFGHVARINLCWKSNDCEGYLQIYVDKKKEQGQQQQQSSSSSVLLSSNTQLRQDILNRGPHQFRFRLDGPEVFVISPSAHQQFLDDGKRFFIYTYDIPTSLFRMPGTYRIGLEMLFRNYAYLDESRDVWPELLKIPLLPIDEEFVQTTKYHLQQCTLPARKDLVLQCDKKNQKNEEESSSLPICDGRHDSSSTTDGTWRREETEQEQKLVTTRVRVRKIRKDPITFEWALQTEPAARWWPRSCRIAEVMKREEIYEKFGGKRIVISGDSQLRALYYAVVNTILGNGDICIRNITTQNSEPRVCVQNVKGSQRKTLSYNVDQQQQQKKENKDSFAPIQVDYIDDLFLNRIKQKLGYNYDVIIAGFAQHPASKEHWRFDKYANAVRERMSQLKKIVHDAAAVASESKKKSSAPKVVWYTAPHYPHTRQGYPVAVKDWRTDSRLELFNNYSTKVARENGFAVMDSFSISDAFMHTSPDQAHFSNFVATEFVRMLFSILMN